MALAGPYIGTLSPNQAGQAIGLIIGITGVALAAVLPVVEKFSSNAALKASQDETKTALAATKAAVETAKLESRANFLYLLDWCLTPLVEKLAVVVQEKKNTRQIHAEVSELKQQALRTVKEMIGTDPTRIRVNYFKLEYASGTAVLKAHGSTATAPRNQFDFNTEEGMTVLEMLAQNGYRFCADVDSAPPPGWNSEKPRPYKTFISVTASAGVEPDGMLTVDGVRPGDLSESDVSIVKLVSTIVAISEAQLQPQR